MSKAVQLVFLSVVVLTCLQTGVTQNVQNELSQFFNDTANQVMRGILPTLKELQGMINSFKNDMYSLNDTVNNMSIKVNNVEKIQSRLSAKIDTLDSKLDSVKANMKKKFNNVKSQLKEYKQQTAFELTELQSNVTSELAGVWNTTSDLHRSFQSNTQQLCAKMDTLDLKMVSVNASVREELKSQLEEHKQQTASELAGLQSTFDASLTCQTEQLSDKMDQLNASIREKFSAMEGHIQQTAAGLQSNVTTGLAGLHASLQSNTHFEQLTQLCEKDDTSSLKGGLSSLNDSMNRISDNVQAYNNHVTSELMKLDQNLQRNFTLLLENSLGYIYPVYTCGGTGGWRRVVYSNFTYPNTTCPQLTSHSKRTCGRVGTARRYTCDSVTFPVSGGNYTRVCGRIIAYQYWNNHAFHAFAQRVATIDGVYVDGVSLTHGNPRQHIWTFAAGSAEFSSSQFSCPCDTTRDISIPSFVGGDYFCESGINSWPLSNNSFYPNDPLWDGDGCTATSTCCSFNNPPYFTKQLPILLMI